MNTTEILKAINTEMDNQIADDNTYDIHLAIEIVSQELDISIDELYEIYDNQ